MKHALLTCIGLLLAHSAFAMPSTNRAATKMTLVADYDHAGAGARNTALSVLERFSGNRRCVLVEVPPNFNLAMRAYMFKQSSYEATVQKEIAKYQHVIGYRFQNVVPSSFLTSVAQLNAQAIGIDFSEGSAMALRVRKVWTEIAPYLDHLEAAPRATLEQFAKMLESRSAIMAMNAARIARTGGCQEIVLVVGEGHLRDQILGIPMRSLQTNLARYGISSNY